MDDVTRRLSAAERESASRVAAAEEETRVARSALAAMRDANQLEASAAAAAHQKYRRDVSEEDARLRRQIASAIADAEGAAAAAAGARAREEETQSRCVELIEAREEQMRRCRDLAAAELRSAEAAAAEAYRALRDEAAEVRRALQDAEAAAAGDRTRADNALEDERRRRVAAEEEAAVRESSSVPFSSLRFSSILFNSLQYSSHQFEYTYCTRTDNGTTIARDTSYESRRLSAKLCRQCADRRSLCGRRRKSLRNGRGGISTSYGPRWGFVRVELTRSTPWM